MNRFRRLFPVVFTVCALLSGASSWGAVRVYPAPDGANMSTAYTVAVEGREIAVYGAKVPARAPIPRRTVSEVEFGIASFASFDMNAPVKVTVTCPNAVTSVKVLPTSFGIVPAVDGKRLTFTLDSPRNLTIEVNGEWQESLHIFANPFEESVPKQGDPNVVYFGPGIHEVTSLTVGDNTTVYIAGGAVVRCVMDPPDTTSVRRRSAPPSFSLKGKNIAFRGRGVIDSGAIPVRGRNTLFVGDSADVTIEGVTFLDASPWTVPIRRSDRVHVDNIKIIGWRGNSDGIDICNSRDVLVENCFLRTLDDLVVIKSDKGQGEVKNVHVRKCVLWNEFAHALSIGAELRENVSGVLFEDCDVIHDVGREWALRVYHCDYAVMSDIRFENIRIEETRRFISLWIGKTVWSLGDERGAIRGVTFKDITAVSSTDDAVRSRPAIELAGFDADHLVEDVVFENVKLDGKTIGASDVKVNEFVRNVRYEP